MSYSRWGNSRWYTYWLAMESNRRADQIFVVLDIDGDAAEGVPAVTEYRYGAVRANPLGVARKHAAQLGTASEAEIKELASYMRRWCGDVGGEGRPSDEFQKGDK